MNKKIMWVCIALAALLAACGAPPAAPELDPNVVGGRNAAIEDYPWMAAIVSAEDGVARTVDNEADNRFEDVLPVTDAPDSYEFLQSCGGSLINESWILSAAHCFSEPGAQLSFEGAEGEVSVGGFADAFVVEEDKSYVVPNQVAFAGLNSTLDYAGQVVIFTALDEIDDIDTTCASNEAFNEAVETGQAIAVEVLLPDTLEEARALVEELGQETCSPEELAASYVSNLEGNVVEISNILPFDAGEPEPAPEPARRSKNSAAKTLDSSLPTAPVSGRRVFLTTDQNTQTQEELAVNALLDALKEGSVEVSYSPDKVIKDPARYNVMMGSESLNLGDFRAKNGDVVAVEEILIHPNYSPTSTGLTYDYALLRLERPIERPTIALEREDIAGGVATSLLGWGFTEGSGAPEPAPEEPETPEEPEAPEEPIGVPELTKLQVADKIQTLSDEDCQARLEALNDGGVIFPNPFDVITPTVLCTNTFSEEEERALDACNGDSGGPLFREDEEGNVVQVGIASFGYGSRTDCGGEDGVGAYARVSSGALWITRTMNMNGQW